MCTQVKRSRMCLNAGKTDISTDRLCPTETNRLMAGAREVTGFAGDDDRLREQTDGPRSFPAAPGRISTPLYRLFLLFWDLLDRRMLCRSWERERRSVRFSLSSGSVLT